MQSKVIAAGLGLALGFVLLSPPATAQVLDLQACQMMGVAYKDCKFYKNGSSPSSGSGSNDRGRAIAGAGQAILDGMQEAQRNRDASEARREARQAERDRLAADEAARNRAYAAEQDRRWQAEQQQREQQAALNTLQSRRSSSYLVRRPGEEIHASGKPYIADRSTAGGGAEEFVTDQSLYANACMSANLGVVQNTCDREVRLAWFTDFGPCSRDATIVAPCAAGLSPGNSLTMGINGNGNVRFGGCKNPGIPVWYESPSSGTMVFCGYWRQVNVQQSTPVTARKNSAVASQGGGAVARPVPNPSASSTANKKTYFPTQNVSCIQLTAGATQYFLTSQCNQPLQLNFCMENRSGSRVARCGQDIGGNLLKPGQTMPIAQASETFDRVHMIACEAAHPFFSELKWTGKGFSTNGCSN